MNAKSIRTFLRYEEIKVNFDQFLIKSAKKLFAEGYCKAFFMIEFQEWHNEKLMNDLISMKYTQETEQIKLEFRYASSKEKEVLL
jgi:hypothetical protein